MTTPNDLQLFSLSCGRDLAARIASNLQIELGRHEERDFEDGEHKIRPLESVRGRDVYVVQSLHGEKELSASDKLCRLLFFLGALRDAGAERVTAVTPYLCYARKDRRTKPRDPVTTRYVAALFEAVQVDRIVTVDVHNPSAYENAFRIPTEHLTAAPTFIDHFRRKVDLQRPVVVSPDAGGVKRAEQFRQALERAIGRSVGSAFLEKFRSEGVVSGSAVVGDVEGSTAIIIDDLVSSGTTLARAAEACRRRGARAVYAAATHGIFVGDAAHLIEESKLERVVVLDTIPPFRLPPDLIGDRVEVLDSAPLLAAAVRRLHTGGSLVELTES